MVTSEEVAVILERRAVGYPTVYQDGKVTNFYEQMIADIDFLLAERAKLVAVLEWYADIGNYETAVQSNNDNMEWCEGVILSDLGTRARIALGKPRPGDLEAG